MDKPAITIAAVSCRIEPCCPEANLLSIERWALRAAGEGAELVLFNETSAMGYCQDLRLRELAEPLDGPVVRRLQSIAAGAGIVIAAGIIEAAGDLQYNTHVLVGPGGLLGLHRKSTVPEGEERWFDIGCDRNVIDFRGRKIGIAICYESVFPETCRELAHAGAQVILAPYANAVTAGEILAGKRPYFSARARENSVWYVACDQCGVDPETGDPIAGAVCFVDPSGEIAALSEDPGEHTIALTLDLRRARS